MARLTIDGKRVVAEEGRTLLEAAREAGIPIPALCHHEPLEAWGGCRLCVVEITHPDWGGWRDLVTSCLYPVKEGLVVSTGSEMVIDARRTVLDLLLARCPDAVEIRRLAAEHGVTETSFVEPPVENRRCILCTLCTRVCERFGANAIGTTGRGVTKRIAPPFDLPAEDCVGCLSCVHICPTDAIEWEEADGVRRIWGREFELVRCEDCGTPLLTREQVAFEAKRSGLTADYFTRCPECKRRETAERIATTFAPVPLPTEAGR